MKKKLLLIISLFAINALVAQTRITVTWDGAAWSPFSPNSAIDAILDGNYDTSVDGEFDAFSLVLNTGKKLKITDGKTISIGDTYDAYGRTYVFSGGELEVDGDVSNEKKLAIYDGGTVSVGGDFDTTDNVDCDGEMYVEGSFSASDKVDVPGILYVGEDYSSSGKLYTSNEIAVFGDFDTSGAVTIEDGGTLTVDGSFLSTAPLTLETPASAVYITGDTESNATIKNYGKISIIDGNFDNKETIHNYGVIVMENGNIANISIVHLYTDADFILENGDLFNNTGGTFYLDNGASFVQLEGTASVSGTGEYYVERETTPYAEYDYTYFSSPSSTATIQDFVDSGTDANYIWKMNTSVFNDADANGFDDDGSGSEWEAMTGNLVKGVGYAVLGQGCDLPFDPSDIDPGQNFTQKVIFHGEFNYGNIAVDLVVDADSSDGYDNLNLIGNPYPSAIDIEAFYNDNSSKVGDHFHFWTHNTQLTLVPGYGYEFTNDDYSQYSIGLHAGVASASGGAAPTRFIVSGQAFLAEATANNQVFFKNTQRVVGNNAQMLSPTEEENNMLRVNLNGDNGDFRQVLIGFIHGATNDYESYYDATRLENGNHTDFYSLINNDNKHYSIQGLPTFQDTQVVKLGLEIVQEGNYSFSLGSVDGVFADGQAVYLYDNYTNIVHNLSEGEYNFTTTVGEAINDRFEIRFVADTMSVNESVAKQLFVYPNPSNGVFNLTWKGTTTASMQVFDLSGKLMLENKEIDNPNSTYQFDMAQFEAGVYFVKLNTNGKTYVEKIVLN